MCSPCCPQLAEHLPPTPPAGSRPSPGQRCETRLSHTVRKKQRVRKQLHYLCAVISSTNHLIRSSPRTVRRDQWNETREETVALMIRNEATLPCSRISATLARRPLSTCRWVAGTQHFKQPPPLAAAPPAWLRVSLQHCHGYQSENSVPIKIQAVVSFEPRRNKAREFNLCLFFFFPNDVRS